MIEWFRGLWRFYLAYTKTGVHAAAAAGLAIFGLLMFVDDAFAVLAIASYVLPPVILYVRTEGSSPPPGANEDPLSASVPARHSGAPEGRSTASASSADDGAVFDGETDAGSDGGNSDGDDGDTDSDGDDGDTDSDGDDGDTDSDSDDGDTDS